MTRTSRFTVLVLTCGLAVLGHQQRAAALGQETFGPAGEHISRSSDWPAGVEDLLRHRSRVYWYWVNGNERAHYEGDIAAVNQLLALFAEIDLPVHDVILRPGSPQARSFQGQMTPYNVEFDVPSGIYLHHARGLAPTGMYSLRPQLTIHVSEEMLPQLDKLQVPKNVRLQTDDSLIERAVTYVESTDRTLAYRAVSILSASGNSSQVVTDALKRAAEHDEESVAKAATAALEELADNRQSGDLYGRVAEFVSRHPRRFRELDHIDLLIALKKADEQFAAGCTITGTLNRALPAGGYQQWEWTVTMTGERLVIQRQAVDSGQGPAKPGEFKNTIYVGPEYMALIQQQRSWINGELHESRPHASFEEPGTTYDILIGRTLWPLGLSFSGQVEQITAIEPAANGILNVEAAGRHGMRWELAVDAEAGYLVRTARGFRGNDTEPQYQIENAGVLNAADLFVPHTAQFTEGAFSHPIPADVFTDPTSFAVTSITADVDQELIDRVESLLKEERGSQ